MYNFTDTEDNKWRNTEDNHWQGVPDRKSLSKQPDKPIVQVGTSVGTGDYGRKPYVTNEYNEMMGASTWRGIMDRLKGKLGKMEPQSEFEKPYLSDNYNKMQQLYPWPLSLLPWFRRKYPRFTSDIQLDKAVGWYVTGCGLDCTPSIIRRCKGEEFCCVLNPAWQPVASIELDGPGTLTNASQSANGTGDKICFTLTEAARDGDTITVKVSTKPKPGQKKGGYCEESFSVHCDKCTCPATFTYDSGNPTTMAANATQSIVVTEGCPPYSWAVTGTGFSFASATTNSGLNTLIASETACGMANITVTDNCGTQVTGSVRCTTGVWALKETSLTCGHTNFLCPAGWCSAFLNASCSVIGSREIIEGNKKWFLDIPKCLWKAGGVCNTGNIVWDKTGTAYCACADPVSYPPPCGNPVDCSENECADLCQGQECLHCMYDRYRYYEWECA